VPADARGRFDGEDSTIGNGVEDRGPLDKGRSGATAAWFRASATQCDGAALGCVGVYADPCAERPTTALNGEAIQCRLPSTISVVRPDVCWGSSNSRTRCRDPGRCGSECACRE